MIGALNISGGKVIGVAFALFCIAVFLGPVSGGHVNPAVTLAVFIAEKDMKNALYMVYIWVSQIAGAFAGIAFAGALQTYKDKDATPYPGIAVLCPNPLISVQKTTGTKTYHLCQATSWAPVFFAEVFGTFIFIGVIMAVVYYNG